MTKDERKSLVQRCVEEVKEKRREFSLTYASPKEWQLDGPQITEIIAPILVGTQDDDLLLIRHCVGFECAQRESFPE
jgi:hypothetical protein